MIVQQPEAARRVITLTGARFQLGRSSACDLCVLDDHGLSRQHAAVYRDRNGWVLEDLGSKNGTFLNGDRIKQPAPLSPGDRIGAGALVVLFDAGADSTAQVEFVAQGVDASDASSEISGVASLFGSREGTAAMAGARHIEALLRAGQELSRQRPLEELCELILALAVESVGAERGMLMTLEDGALQLRAAKGGHFRVSNSVRDRVLRERVSLLVMDTGIDQMLKSSESIVAQQIRSIMAVPLESGGKATGLLYVDSRLAAKPFTREDLSLLTVLANTAAARIENARLVVVEQQELLRERDLAQAAEIQRQFLPLDVPEVAGLDVASLQTPCQAVGGDYFDFLDYPDGSLGVTIADVSGKGMPAALLMGNLQASVRALGESRPHLADFVAKVNHAVTRSCPAGRFITFFFAVVDPVAGRLDYSNAGQNAPAVIRADGRVERLETGGPVLGIIRDLTYEEGSTPFLPGDTLVLFSDGVSEASRPQGPESPSAHGEDFGEDRLVEVANRARSENAEGILDAIRKAWADWLAGSPANDDMTLVVVKRRA